MIGRSYRSDLQVFIKPVILFFQIMRFNFKTILLNLYFWPMFLVITIIAVLLVPIFQLLNLIVFKRPENRLFRKGIRIYGLIIIRALHFMAPLRFEDRSGGLPRRGIIVVNHQSAADPFCFGIMPGEYAFMTSWPFKIPVYNLIMKRAEYIDSSKGWKEILSRSFYLLEKGCSLIIWPEGHRSRDGRLREFRNGAFRIACETGLPIVPVCITGTGKLLPPGRRFLSPARITLTVLRPCFPDIQENKRKAVIDLKDKVWKDISRELTERQLCHE